MHFQMVLGQRRRDVLELADDPPQTVARLAPGGRLSPFVRAVRAAKEPSPVHQRINRPVEEPQCGYMLYCTPCRPVKSLPSCDGRARRRKVCLRATTFRRKIDVSWTLTNSATWTVARAVVRHHALDPDAKLCKITDRGLQEGNCSLLALIDQDLHERDPRGIIDADMNELPTDTVVTVDCTGISPSDAVAHRADPSELFDIEMDRWPGCSRS